MDLTVAIDKPVATRVIRYENDGVLIGRRYFVETAAGGRWIGEVHDWDNGRDGTEYDPLILGLFEDPDEIGPMVEYRARMAQGANGGDGTQ